MVSSIQATFLTEVPPASDPATAPAAQPAPTGSAGPMISGSAQLLSRLQQLAHESPSKFQAIATSASQGLQALASQTGGEQGQAASRLANAFAQAGSTGDLSALHALAAAATSGGRHHRHGGAVQTIQGLGAPPVTQASAPGARAQALLADVSEQVDEAMGMAAPPLGPWFSG